MKAVTIIQIQTFSYPSKILVPRCSQASLLPPHWQPLICSLSPQTCLFGAFHLNGIIQYVVSCVWLPSPSIKFLWFIHGAACIDVSFLLNGLVCFLLELEADREWVGRWSSSWADLWESLEPSGWSQLGWWGLLTSHNAQDSPTAQYYVAPMSVVLKLRIPGLDFTEFLLIFKVLFKTKCCMMEIFPLIVIHVIGVRSV